MIMRMLLPRLLPWIIGALSLTAVVGFLVNRGYNWGISKGQKVIEKFDGDTRQGLRDFNTVTARENSEYRAAQERGQAQYPAPVGDE
jgi:hypothetical protein